MSTPSSGTKWTYEEYLLIPDDRLRHEIIDGEEHVSPAPTARHQRLVVRIAHYFEAQMEKRAVGEVLVSPIDVVLSEYDIVQPDIVFITSRRSSIVGERVAGAPDLVVEVLSEGTRRQDEVLKRRRYEIAGVGEYWVVDPELDSVKVYRLAGKSYARTAELSAEKGDILSTPLIPELQIPLKILFRR